MHKPTLILIPPSEGKSAGGDGAPLNLDTLSFASLNVTRSRMLKAVRELGERPRTSRRLLGVKGPALERAMTDNASVETAPTMPAIDRYTGVMYDAIAYRELDDPARQAFNESAVIMSGLFGMLKPLDPIPAYKLKMSSAIVRGKTCASIWKRPNTKALTDLGDHGLIWDLLPIEHSAAWDPGAMPHDSRIKVRFIERRSDGTVKTVSHMSKMLKGALIQHICANRSSVGSAEAATELMAEFSHPAGYNFDSTHDVDGATEIVFLKT